MFANKKRDIDLQSLRQRLRYGPSTGHFVWLGSSNARTGRVAGFQKKDKYIRIKFLGREFMAHILAWAMTYGEIPELEIDHINRDRTDNRIENLRLATRLQNVANRGVGANGVVGATPVYGKWQAQIQRNRRHHYLGVFDTLDEARAAYTKADAILESGKSLNGECHE